jgi:hypothetical protein
MSVMRKCVRCRQPVVVYRVTMGHEVAFEPARVKGGRWALDDGGVMRRFGRFSTGYQPHSRLCR